MGAIRTQISVGRCTECPMFERNVLSVIADLVGKREARSGACRYNGIGMAFPTGRLPILDENVVPTWCPLRAGDCLIQLKVPG